MAEQLLERAICHIVGGPVELPSGSSVAQADAIMMTPGEILQVHPVSHTIDISEATSLRSARFFSFLQRAVLKQKEARLRRIVVDAITH